MNEYSYQGRRRPVTIKACALPDGSYLASYARSGAYTDCFVTSVSGAVSFERYVAAFYCTPLFKLERVILKFALSRPSTDAQAEQLAAGDVDRFAVWSVEQRSANQLLLCDLNGATRSCLMLDAGDDGGRSGTRLYFGSAVVPRAGRSAIGFGFRALLGFHKLYSRLLLNAARDRLQVDNAH